MTESAAPGTAQPNQGERRERRRGDRRGANRDNEPWPATQAPDDSLLGAPGVGADRGRRGEEADGAERSGFVPGWGEASQPADSRFLSRQARRIVSAGSSTFERLYRIFVGARAVLGVALLLTQLLGNLLGARSPLALTVCVLYAAQALTLWILPRFRSAARAQTRLTRRQWLATIGFDLLTFSALHALAPGTAFNYVALLVLPVLMAGVLTARLPALATAAAVALMLLAAAWQSGLHLGDLAATMTPAGLAGIGFFVITLLTGELASRLAREEMTARGSLELARQQAQLNRLVIEEMADGVLVIDRRTRVRAANPAARRLLAMQGLGPAAPFQLQDEPAWAELSALAQLAFEAGRWPEGARDLALHFAGGVTRTLRLRARFTRPRASRAAHATAGEADAAGEVFCVVFVEDLRSVQARTRQEKLAAMGRVSAGIAHEIRNPLAAIAQANALLAEEVVGAEQQMLTTMVADNVERLKRLVDDVMEVAPGIDATPRTIDLGAEVGRIVADWARTSQFALGSGSRLHVELPHEPMTVLFEPEHLRRVLVNLLDNARRYASNRPGAIVLRAEALGGAQARLSLASDGDPIPADIEPYLFEPFFSTRSRGTGLGLYICRELCERYGGSIDYWQHPDGSPHRNEFVVTARVAADTAPTPSQNRLLP
ncbi:MAG: ATP-binding protein [Burkholderiaceae bacterium]|nr:ATP-binding protein [Burkholderiaceae bacterium]